MRRKLNREIERQMALKEAQKWLATYTKEVDEWFPRLQSQREKLGHKLITQEEKKWADNLLREEVTAWEKEVEKYSKPMPETQIQMINRLMKEAQERKK